MWIESIDSLNNKNYTQIFNGVGYQIQPTVRNGRLVWQSLKNGVFYNWGDSLDVVKSYIEDVYKKPVAVGDKVERKWGYYEILAIGEGYLVKKLVFKPHLSLSYQFHTYRKECWQIIKGDGIFRTERSSSLYDYFDNWNPYKSYLSPPPKPLFEVNETKKAGDVIEIGILQKHKWTAGENGTEIIEIWSGSKLDENDITRIDEV